MLEAKWKLKGPVLTVEDEYIQDQSVVESDMKILITGESGTGKTRLAKKIHSQSKRSGQFIGINLSAYNPSLIESELFGHKKGAFTGAVSDKCGAFKLANWGTLFLDEIDSLPIELQTKLLGFLDDKTFRAVGDTREEKINARLIFASGRPLESLVEKGLFRKDFYYRLKTGHGIELKPLRDDVSLIDRVLDQFCLENNITLTYRLREFYLSLSWPGNLRELYGHLEKKRILTKGRKFDFDLCDEELITKSTDLYSFEKEIQSLEDTKREYVSKILGHFQGNYQLAAKNGNADAIEKIKKLSLDANRDNPFTFKVR
jgi:DNA-binding NtrC family response regulator